MRLTLLLVEGEDYSPLHSRPFSENISHSDLPIHNPAIYYQQANAQNLLDIQRGRIRASEGVDD
jgi:hypothetical protein